MTMAKRLYIYLRYYFTVVAVFIVGKLLFMAVNGGDHEMALKDAPAIVWHGLSLDCCMAGYLAIVPLFFFALMKQGNAVFKAYNVVVALLMAVAIVVDAFLYGFWGFRLDATVLNYIDQPEQAFASVSAWYIIVRLFVIAVVAVAIYLVLPRKALKTRRNPWMLFLAAPLFVVIRGGVSESTANVGMVYFSDRQFLNHAAINPMFSFLASISKEEDFSEQFNFFGDEECQDIFHGLYAGKDSVESLNVVLKTDRPNILLVIMEGFGSNVMEATSGNKKVAPNITAIANKGLFFSQCFANSFRTDRGVVSILSGFPGQPTTSVMKMANRCSQLPSIAKSMKRSGYETEFIYGGDINFTNMRGYLLSTGYGKLVAKEDFSLSEQNSNAWGAQDEYTSRRVLEEIKLQKSTPWFVTYLTLSSHEPFEVPQKIIANDDVLNSFAYTDRCLGKLVDELEKSPIWDNLLVIMLPDHNIRGVKSLGSADQYSPEFYHIPMIWTGGALREDVRGKQVEAIMSQTDLAATLLGQMGIKHDEYVFSHNVLGDYEYQFAFGSFNNGFVFRDSTGVTIYDNEAQKVAVESPSSSPSRLQYGRAILQTLYDEMGKLGTKSNVE